MLENNTIEFNLIFASHTLTASLLYFPFPLQPALPSPSLAFAASLNLSSLPILICVLWM